MEVDHEEQGILEKVFNLQNEGIGDLRFVPAGAYSEILNQAAVRAELGIIGNGLHSYDDDLVDFVLNDAPKIFMMLLNIFDEAEPKKKRRLIRRFKDQEFSDENLPIEKGDCDSSRPAFSDEIGWKPTSRFKFFHCQWEHLAPIFSHNNFILSLDSRQPLPFLEGPQEETEGASSVVRKVQLHRDHLLDPPLDCTGSRREIAIKEVNYGDFKEQFDNEAKALKEISDLGHEHIIQWLAAFTHSNKYFLMFPWADGGNMRNFWREVDPLALDTQGIRKLIWDTLRQFRGLADALDCLHVKKQYRHGDVKPENILRFKNANPSSMGTLKIADFGLAKQHDGSTAVRHGPTTTRHTTLQYESPEAEVATKGDAAMSRLTDIWSLGCVMLEYLIWLVYGYVDGVERFNDELKEKDNQDGSHDRTVPFYRKGVLGKVEVHPTVQKWMNHMLRDSQDGALKDTAIGLLVALVKDNLLVTDAGLNWQEVRELQPGIRASAKELRDRLDDIISQDWAGLFPGQRVSTQGRFWSSTGGKRRKLEGPASASQPTRRDYLDPVNAYTTVSIGVPVRTAQQKLDEQVPLGREYVERMNKNWEFAIDEEFPTLLDTDVMYPSSLPGAADLCEDCAKLDFGIPGFQISYGVQQMRQRASTCGLCRILWRVICDKQDGRTDVSTLQGRVKFERIHSNLMMQDHNEPVLSLIASPELKPFIPLQRGFPKLPEPGSATHFKTIRQWLSSCDKSHPECTGPRGHNTSLPTRLLDVGNKDSPTIHLIETKDLDTHPPSTPPPYIALSHPWGAPPHFCTYPDDPSHPSITTTLTRHKTLGIQVSSLPKTFQHAVITTRALGKRYLWIDSLCILQGPNGDFKDEAKKMESVFSEAYVILAASWAEGQDDGFLSAKARASTTPSSPSMRDREVVTVVSGPGRQKPGAAVYVCEMIDKFEDDVLKGHLNTRAWVLQERALARRTVYFTGRQTYWECGGGVRCETGTRMTNKLASYLGDPSFPSIALGGNRGEEIRWYQELYEQYSRLGLSHIEDRPIAIRALESRLIAKFAGKYRHHDNGNFTGGWGVLNDGARGGHLHRSLLWWRPAGRVAGDGDGGTDMTPRGHLRGAALKKIHFPPGYEGVPPSWSWMAWSGEIEYVKVEGGTVEWLGLEVYPGYGGSLGGGGDTRFAMSPPRDGRSHSRIVIAKAWEFNTKVVPLKRAGSVSRDGIDVARNGSTPSGQLVYDAPCMTVGHGIKCVIVGREKGDLKKDGSESQGCADRMYFVLIVKPVVSAGVENVQCVSEGELKDLKRYERIGAGSMVGRCILGLEGGGESIAVV